MPTEYYSGGRSKVAFQLETTAYGTQEAAPDGWLGIFQSFDVNEEIGWVEHEGVDTDTIEVDDMTYTTKKVTGMLKYFPQHGAIFPYVYGVDEYVSGTPSVHGFSDLLAPDYTLPSMTVEATHVHSTAGSGHTTWQDGGVVSSFELTFEQENYIEFALDMVFQDRGSSDDSGQAYEASDVNRIKYPLTGTGNRSMFHFGHVYAEINGTQVTPLSGRLKIDNNLNIDYQCDASVGRKIAEPVIERRKYEFEMTARMANDTYYDIWEGFSSTVGTLAGFLDEAGDIVAGDTSFDIDSGSTVIANLPKIGIIKIGSEYMLYYDMAIGGAENTLTVVRGCYGSTAAGHSDDAAVEIYGAVTLMLNKGTDAIDSIDHDGDEDYLLFTMWDCPMTAYSVPLDVGKGIIEQTMTFQPLHCVVTAVDDLAIDFATK